VLLLLLLLLLLRLICLHAQRQSLLQLHIFISSNGGHGAVALAITTAASIPCKGKGHAISSLRDNNVVCVCIASINVGKKPAQSICVAARQARDAYSGLAEKLPGWPQSRAPDPSRNHLRHHHLSNLLHRPCGEAALNGKNQAPQPPEHCKVKFRN
jgi:hypothetical protein